MNRLEVLDLLVVVAVYDNRDVTAPAEVAKWTEASKRGRWEVRSACEAVHEFFAMPHDPRERRRWLEPSHVAFILKAKRSGPPPVAELRSVASGPPASAEARARAMASFRVASGAQEVDTEAPSVTAQIVSKLDPIGTHQGDPVRGFAGAMRRRTTPTGDRP
jgi:hypothetical protein